MATTVTSPIILDETGKDIVSAIERVALAIGGQKGGIIYGFHIDGNESDPASMVTYVADAAGMTPAHMDYSTGVFDYGDWEDAFFMPRPCMLTSAGTVGYYLNPNDYTKKEDGTASDIANTLYDGNAMMEWGRNGKKIWIKIVPSSDGKSATVYIADHKADEGFNSYPFNGASGESKAHFYTPIYNGSVIDSKMRSLSGQAVSNKLTAPDERTAAQANGTGWDIETFGARQLINFLLILMAKTTDTQTAFGQGLHTGGSEANNNNFRTGVHNTKGLFYGTNSGTETSSDFSNAVKVFGMENWYGFQWRRIIGWICANGIQKVKLGYGTADGSTVSDYNLTGDGYIALGATPSGTSGGYISEMSFSDKAMLPKVASGTATTKYTDGLWFNLAIVAVALVGGSSSSGLLVGALYSSLTYAASLAYWNSGAALSYV